MYTEFEFFQGKYFYVFSIFIFQEGQEIYFLAVKQINPNEELFVWYGEEMFNRIQNANRTKSQYEVRKPSIPYTVSQYQHEIIVSSLV